MDDQLIVNGVPTGWPSLEKVMEGIKREDLLALVDSLEKPCTEIPTGVAKFCSGGIKRGEMFTFAAVPRAGIPLVGSEHVHQYINLEMDYAEIEERIPLSLPKESK